MRRAAIFALLGLAACNGQGVPAPAQLSGTYNLAMVNDLNHSYDLLFVNSADRDELRVLDLHANPIDFVRAPNPIEPLSIPVVERPVELIKDTHYEDQLTSSNSVLLPQVEVGGPYVYVRSAALPQISVVASDRAVLKEVARIGPRESLTLPVTAMTALGPTTSAAADPSILYFATSALGASNVYSVTLPNDWKVVADGGYAFAPVPVPLASEDVVALLALPDRRNLVVATRSNDGTGGRTFRYDTVAGTSTPLQFSSPVRLLKTHPGYWLLGNGTLVDAGATVFAFLDENSCGGGAQCTGVMAVDTATGNVSTDYDGLPMLPIGLGHGLLQDVTFAPFAVINRNPPTDQGLPNLGLPPGEGLADAGPNAGLDEFSLLGLATVSDGSIFMFDAADKVQVDANVSPASYVAPVQLQPPDAGAVGYPVGSGSMIVSITPDGTRANNGDGNALSETVTVTNQGVLPGTQTLPTDDSQGNAFPIDPALAAVLPIEPGDRVGIYVTAGATCGEARVLDVGDGGVLVPFGSGSALTTEPIPSGCSPRTAFEVRAGRDSADPYVVSGSVSGFMFRTRPGNQKEFTAAPFFHTYPAPQGVRFGIHLGQTASGAIEDPAFSPRDSRFIINVASNFSPFFFTVDPISWPNFTLPAGIVHQFGYGQSVGTAYVAYPSANAIMAFNPFLMTPLAANVRNLAPYQ